MQALLEYKAQIELYKNIFYFSLIVGLVFAILTILLCVIFRVDEVVGDITGAYKRKAIKKHKGDSVSGMVSRGYKNTSYSSRRYADGRSRTLESTEEITARLRGTAALSATEKLGEETVLLDSDDSTDETVVLSEVNAASDDTVVLSEASRDVDETVVLSASDETDELVSGAVTLEEDVIVSSSNKYL